MRLADFGLFEGINEVIGITFKADGSPNTAPLGIIVDDAASNVARVRLYASHTRENVEREGKLYVNVVWDAVIFAMAAFEDLDSEWFESMKPPVLKGAVSWCEFDAELKGGFAELRLVDGNVLRAEPRAFNRGFAALIELLILATRYVTADEIARSWMEDRIAHLGNIVQRCGGEREKIALDFAIAKAGIKL